MQARTIHRKNLEDATTAYYASLSGEALRTERSLERALSESAALVDFDGE
jgi:hypothetical protein